MKTQRIQNLKLSVIVLLMFASVSVYSQGMRNSANKNFQSQNCQLIPDLTEKQQAKIETLRIAHLKEMTANRNQLNELRAKKHTLMTSDNANLNEINSIIDQMTDIQNKKMKSSAKHRQAIRSLLSDGQKVYFDNNHMHRRGQGRGNGRNFEHGRGYGRSGYGRGLN